MQNKNPISWIPSIFKEAESLDTSEVTTQVESSRTLLSGNGAPKYESSNDTSRSIRWARILTLGVVGTFLVILGAGYYLTHVIDGKTTEPNSTIATTPTSYTVMNLPLNNLAETGQLQINQNSQVTLNGQLHLNNATVLTPISQPATPVAGEFYYDKTTNQPYYYNGTQYVSMSSPGVVVNSIGGLSGIVQLGAGLEVNNGKIATIPGAVTPKSIVTSLQGESGTVLLVSGEGINISGTTISSTVGITSVSSDLVVTPDGNGNFSLSLSGSGSSGTVALGPASAQADGSANPSIFINKTGSGNLLEMQFNGTDQFVVNSSGAITSGTIPYSNVTGAPSIVNSIGGQSGAITLGGGLNIAGSLLSNSGVTNIGGTANQVNVSATVGNVTISLPQNIGVTATPTFAGLTLNTTPLAVTSGGTGATTASGARTNLGAAASGANSDITSLTTVTAINDGASSITVGSTGATLTLQGSVSSTIVAGSGANTTSLAFAALSGNNTITFPASSGTVCTTIGNCLGSGGGANAALSNLSSVAINTSLLAGTTTINLGSATAPFNNLYLGGSTSNNFELTGIASGGTQVLTLPNASGTICLDNSVSCGFATSGSGVSSITGTANQINASSSTGAITLSLPQSIGTSSTPTFGGLTLSTALSVANGGTGATTASGARTNLSAAASGANSDITSLTAVTAINDGAATITVGSTGGVLNLQGSSTSTFSVGSGANTTSLAFASLSGNNTITFPASTGTVCTTIGNCLGSGGGANVGLSNLSGVAINTSLLPGSTTIDLGSATAPFNNLYLGGSTSNNFELTGTATGGTQVLTLPNASGTICLEGSANCGFGSSGSGVTSITGTPNQVIASSSAGNITLSLPQSIATTSTPTFAGLTLSTTPLVVTSGGTGSTTAAGARGNLGAAASGANSDITSLTTVTAINDGASSITVGNSGGVLSLQGSAASTIVAGSGANTTSLAFAALSGNNTITFPSSTGTVCTTIGNCLGSGGGANAALSNLSSVAINTSLLPGTTTIDLGSATAPFNNLYLGGSTSNNFELTGTATGGTQVLTLPNASGTICLDNSVSCGFATSGSGVSSITGTANQVNASASTGAITLSLPQNIGTSSTPTFGGLTLSTALSVANGGTGATTASGARTNLSAAASGANSDITSLTTVSAISDGVSTITVGNTGGVLALQGSSSSTFSVGSGANTTSLAFASLSGNNTITFPASTGTVCTTVGNCLGGGGGGANVGLSNLSGVAINTSLLPGTTTINLGSATAPFNNLYLGGSTSNNFELTGTATGGTQVLTLPNATGTICLENSVSCGFGSSGSGVTSITGTANQVNASASTGSITLSLPQSIATISSPTFAGLTLSTALSVTNGGTGSTTASGARTNLGAAASGANSDITSLTTVTAINDGASSITVGSTGATLTLQGSVSSTIVAGSGANTTSLAFAALSGNNTITFPASSGTVCLQSSASCGFVTGSGSAIVQNGNSFGTTVTIGSNDLNGVNIRTDGSTVEALSSSGAATFKNTSNSTTAFQIQNAAAAVVLNVDSSNSQVDIGALSPPSNLMVSQAPIIGTATGTGSGTAYTYEITAVSSNGAESLGASESANFGSNIVTNPITLHWTTNGAAYYKIYRTTSAGTPSSTGLIGTAPAAGGTFVDTGFTAGAAAPALATTGSLVANGVTPYYYEITALDDSYTTGSSIGQSAASTQVTGTTNAVNKSLTISWAPVPGARGYNVYRTTTSGVYSTDSYYTVYTNSFTDTGASATGTNTALPVTNTAYSNTLSNNTASDVSVGSNGTATSQLYVSGSVPTVAIGSVATSSQPYSTYIQGNYAYVASSGSSTLQIFDISIPSNPVLVGTFLNSSNLYGVSVQGSYAYVTDVGVHELIVVDISDPADPFMVGSASTGSLPYSLYVSGRYAYVANFGGDSLQIFDISNPASPVNVGTVSTGNGPQSVFVSGSYAYVTNKTDDTLQVINISNPLSPVSAGTANTGTDPYDVYVQSNYAYVVNRGSNSIQIFNVTNPADSINVGTAITGTNPQSIYVSGRYAYVTNWLGNTLQIFDISNPADPIGVGAPAATGVDPQSLTVQGRYAYVTNENSATLQVFDLGGAYIQQLQAGGAEVSTLVVDDNAAVAGDESVSGGLTVGNSAQISGNLGVSDDLCVNATSCTGGEALGVEGTIIASGTITASGSPDYAEDITATDPTIGAGDLVSMDPSNPGQVTKSSGAYDPNLIGAISTSPGYLTNAPAGAIDGIPATTDQVPLGLVGRIPVDVDTENGPIAIGDYITSSSTPGVGMVATAPGQVVGIAMTSYSGSGISTITVYLEHFFYNPTVPSGSDTLSSLTVTGQTNLDALTVENDADIIGNLKVSGSTIVANITINGHIISGGLTPNVSVAAGAGSSATVSVLGDDSAGTITLNSGSSGVTNGSQVNVVFANSYGSAPHVLITPNDGGSAALEVYPSNVTSSGFTLNVSAAPQTNASYSFEYLVVQ